MVSRTMSSQPPSSIANRGGVADELAETDDTINAADGSDIDVDRPVEVVVGSFLAAGELAELGGIAVHRVGP